MTPQELKNSILQWAVQGNLVSQDPNDEPAKILLEKIKAEKAELVKQKKIKADNDSSTIFRGQDNLFYETTGTETKCIQDEIPFDIPDSWEWVRLGEISKIIHYGYTASASPVGNAKLLRITDIQNNKVNWDTVPFCNITEKNLLSYQLVKNDIVIARTGGTVGKSFCIFEKLPLSVFASYLIRIKLLLEDTVDYILTYLTSPCYWTQLVNSTSGTGQPNVNGQSLSLLLIPLPPLEEQKRIVKKVQSLQPLIAQYAEADTALQNLEKSFPENLKKSLLQWAVQGKLVPQDPNTEPAKILLEKIKAEKSELVKQKKIKADKAPSHIFRGEDNLFYETIGNTTTCIQDEIPFDIPDSWEWVRLGEISNFGECISVSANEIENDLWVLDLEDIEKNTGKILQKKTKLSNPFSSTKHLFFANQVLYGKLRPYLNKVVVATENGCCSSEILPISFWGNINNYYAQLVLSSPFLVDYATKKSYGTKMPRLGTSDGKKALFPLPPLEEQKRITQKLENLKTLCTELERE
ncbi:restriction endonuclease subunit S [Thomasclavelia cocleata]|jgi:type I restriction enzyme S subunit|uniref:restriction endonuclease subunit S n=1 Tax=Thomasclavelia cocleata TaxID=69824 RepID=UPI0025A2A06F|nr:restriction endonuclease subunit S [Thomasclavelia cocleata]